MAVDVEDRLERRAVVRGFEHAAHREADVEGRRILLIDGDVVDAAAGSDRSDGAPSESVEQRIRRLVEERLQLPTARAR